MLTLNSESWFVRTYLQYGSYDKLPSTICELARAICGMTFLWIMGISAAMFFTSVYILGACTVLYTLFTDMTLVEIFNYGNAENSPLPLPLRSCVTIFWLFNSVASILGIWAAIEYLKQYLKQKKRQKLLEKFEKTGSWEPIEEYSSPAIELVKGIWARIHDKTCTIIHWENRPKESR